MHCTQCGAPGDGAFCGGCGATLTDRECPACRTVAARGRRFCTACGSSLGVGAGGSAARGGILAGVAGDGATAGWWVAGILLVVLIVGGGWLVVSGPGADPAGGAAAGAPPGGGGMNALGAAPHIDLASMTPREAADALFDRVMSALARGDDTEVVNFLPMAIGAYEWARPLDQDGLFHLSVLHSTGSDFTAALGVAEEGLAESPDHLLNLAAAAQAAEGLGDLDRAEGYHERILEVWDRERTRDDRPEYREHERLLPDIRRDAEEFVRGGAE